MSQRIVEMRDVGAFANAFIASRGTRNMDAHNQDLTDGITLGPADGAVSGGPYANGIYLQTTDTYLWFQSVEKKDPLLVRTVFPFVYATDALYRNPDVGWAQPMIFLPNPSSGASAFDFFGGQAVARLICGQPNMRTLEQNFYWYQSSGRWTRYRAADATIPGTDSDDIWPNIGQDMITNGAVDGSTAGYWTAADGGSVTTRWHGVVFEGITDTSDGMPGETDPRAGMIRGSSTHPKGLGLFRSDRFNFEGSGTPSDTTKQTWLWVDLDTGLAVGILGVEALAGSDNTVDTDWQEPSFNKRNGFFWDNVQFVPDVDSSFSKPKGELHFALSSESAYTNTSVTIDQPDSGGSYVSTETNEQLIKVYDFNPFNQTTGPERIHLRRTQTAFVQNPYQPVIRGGNTINELSGSRYDHLGSTVYYHPPSRTYVNVQCNTTSAQNAGTGEPAAGTHRIIRWDRDLTVDAVGYPFPDAAVTENGASYFDVLVTNDISGPIFEHTVYFQTFRASTRAETFDGTAQGASAYVVDNAVIDEDGSLDVREGGNVDSGGTLLVEGVDYTVTYATGTLTPIGSWPTDDIYVRYRHRSVEISPGWGTLSASSALTNIEGIATAVVTFPDNLDGELVGLNVDTETPF